MFTNSEWIPHSYKTPDYPPTSRQLDCDDEKPTDRLTEQELNLFKLTAGFVAQAGKRVITNWIRQKNLWVSSGSGSLPSE